MNHGCKKYLEVYQSLGGSVNITCLDCNPNMMPPPPNMFCDNPQSTCLQNGESLTYSAWINNGSASSYYPSGYSTQYGCMRFSDYNWNRIGPVNPNWFYIDTDQAGKLEFDITTTRKNTNSNADISVLIWGPFNGVDDAIGKCLSNNLGDVLDCQHHDGAENNSGFPAKETEKITIDYVQANQTYLVLISNQVNDFATIEIKATNSSTALTDCSQTPLPIKLLSFTGSANSEGNLLSWVTATEKDNDYFTLTRSTDGKVWEEIARVSGAGNSQKELNYTFLDQRVPMGVSYYKLRQTDFDGNYEEFNIISVNRSLKKEVMVYPNPSKGKFDVSYFAEADGDMQIVITDLLGKVIYQEEHFITKGVNTFPVQVWDKKKGVYLLKNYADGMERVKRVLID